MGAIVGHPSSSASKVQIRHAIAELAIASLDRLRIGAPSPPGCPERARRRSGLVVAHAEPLVSNGKARPLRYSPAVTTSAVEIGFEAVSVARGGRPILSGVISRSSAAKRSPSSAAAVPARAPSSSSSTGCSTPDAGSIRVVRPADDRLGSVRSPPARRLRPPGDRALSAHEHRRERRGRAATARLGRGAGRRRGCGSCWSSPACGGSDFAHRGGRTSCRAGSASGSAWRARSPPTRRFC